MGEDVGSGALRAAADQLLDAPVARRLDLRGETCPTTSDETLRVLAGMAAGDVLEVVSNYEPARSTIPYHCDKRGYRCAFVPEEGGHSGGPRAVWRIRIRRS